MTLAPIYIAIKNSSRVHLYVGVIYNYILYEPGPARHLNSVCSTESIGNNRVELTNY